MSTARTKLNIVDDPVARRPTEEPDSVPASTHRRPASGPGPATAASSAEPTPAATDTSAGAETAAAPAPQRYSEEPKKAVFGRVPRSLSRRLERALMELRDDTDDLTQEQLLAALLDKYVNPADFDNLLALGATVNEYRAKL